MAQNLDDTKQDVNETTGSGWMFYHHYNPELLRALQQVLIGEKVADVVDDLLQDSTKPEGS